MTSIASPACSKIIANKIKESVLWREYKHGGLEVGFFSSKAKHGRLGFLHLVRNQYKGYNPVLASSQSQAESEAAETENHPINESKTVRVKFLLQKECAFGEQFLLVGDDPMLGSWDPESAVPLNWSDGHVWIVELDAPVEKSIQYKFLHKEITGKILWQPEPDRIIQTWNTANTIVVSEDWEDAALQQIIEEELQADQNAESTGSTESENLVRQKEEPVPHESKKTTISDENPHAAKNSSLNNALTEVAEEQVAIVVDDISYTQQNPAVNSTAHVEDPKLTNNSTDEPMAAADKNLVAGKEIASDKRAAIEISESENVNGNLFVPILVPGLPPSSSVPSEVAYHDQDESKKSTDSDASLGVDETKNHIPETIQVDEKRETADSITIGNKLQEETAQMVSGGGHVVESEISQAPAAEQEKKLEVSENPESNALNNDIQWGRQTLQKLLSSLGFM